MLIMSLKFNSFSPRNCFSFLCIFLCKSCRIESSTFDFVGVVKQATKAESDGCAAENVDTMEADYLERRAADLREVDCRFLSKYYHRTAGSIE